MKPADKREHTAPARAGPFGGKEVLVLARLDAFDALEVWESARTRRYVQGVGWCWMEDGEVIEVISEAT